MFFQIKELIVGSVLLLSATILMGFTVLANGSDMGIISLILGIVGLLLLFAALCSRNHFVNERAQETEANPKNDTE